jgi:hypothetical protein
MATKYYDELNYFNVISSAVGSAVGGGYNDVYCRNDHEKYS